MRVGRCPRSLAAPLVAVASPASDPSMSLIRLARLKLACVPARSPLPITALSSTSLTTSAPLLWRNPSVSLRRGRQDGMASTPITSLAQRSLLPPVMMRTPISASPVESAGTIVPISRPVISIARGNHDIKHRQRKRVEDRPRWRWREIVTGRGSAVRFHDLGAGIRAHSGSKAEYENRQCHYNRFFPHDIPPVIWPIEPSNHCKVAKEVGDRRSDRRFAVAKIMDETSDNRLEQRIAF